MTRRAKLGLLAAVAIIWLSAVALPVQAASCNTGRILPACACSGDCSANDFIVMFMNIAQLLLSAVGLLALLFFIAGGFDWITSGGNSDKVSSGRTKMTNAIVGMVIVIAAWAIMNTVYYVFTGSNTVFGTKWFELKAMEDINPPTTAPPTGFGAGTGNCDGGALAKQYNDAKFPADDSQPVLDLKVCILANIDQSLVDMNQIYTFERGNSPDGSDNPLCNYTRGDTDNACTPRCAHSLNSCHYGGEKGTLGAMAIDFNAKPPATEGELAAAIRTAANGPCSDLRGYMQAPEDDHSHVSAKGCDHN